MPLVAKTCFNCIIIPNFVILHEVISLIFQKARLIII